MRELKAVIIRNKIEPTTVKISLLNTDYKNIKVLNKPSRFRKY